MRVKIGGFFIAILSCLFSICYAQTGTSIIRGNVFIQNNQPADAATAVLCNYADSSVVMSALVNNKGGFEFININPGKYLIIATRIGYQKTYSTAFSIASEQTLNISPILLIASNNELKEISIVAKKPFIEVRPGKVIINPAGSIISDGQSVLDILKQSPGVRVDNNDNLSISGRQDALVLIDGKATNLSGSDLATLLKSIQGSNIDRVELIKNGSAKYDASAGGVINIIYKKGSNIGTNGVFNASAGYGRYYKANTGISFTQRTSRYNFFGSYSYSNSKTFKDIFTDRNITDEGVKSSYNSSYNNLQKIINHNFRVGADFYLSPNSTIGFTVAGTINNNHFNKNNTLKIYNKDVLDSTISALSTIDRNFRNTTYNINYTSKLDKAGRTISANVTYLNASRHSVEYITNNFADAAGNAYRQPLLLQNLSPTKINNWTGLLEYTNPLNKQSKLDAGIKFSRTKTDNNLIFGPIVSGMYTSDPNFSNYFLFNESIGAAYLNYTGKFGKFDLNGGLRGEYTYNDGNSVTQNHQTINKYFNLFPSALLNYRYNDKNEYSIEISRGILRPRYEKLNPFLYFIDLYNYQSGNPYLMPEYTNRLTLSHTYNQETVTSLYATIATGAAFPFYQQNDASKISITSDVNLGRVYNYGVNIKTPLRFTSWWNSSYDIDASYQRYVAYSQYGNLNKGTGDLIIHSSQSFDISNTIKAEVSGMYESSTFYGVNAFKPNHYINAGISKQIFNKLGRVSITAEDIFKTRRDRASVNYQNVDLNILDRRETRFVNLNFSYRFGKSSVKGAVRHKTGSEDEEKRIRSSN